MPPVNYKVIQEKLFAYKETVEGLREYFLIFEEKPISDKLEFVSKEIENDGQKIKEICKTAFPNDQDQDNDPFYWIQYYDVPGASPEEQRRNEIDHVINKIDAVQSLIEKKIEKLSLYEYEENSEKDRGDLNKTLSSTEINYGTIIHGNVNITNIYSQIDKIIKEIDESDLEPEKREEAKSNFIKFKDSLQELYKLHGPQFVQHGITEGVKFLSSN